MEPYPGNSRKVTAPTKTVQEPKKIERVVEGQVIRRKKPLGKRIQELFIGGDSRSVGQYIMLDVLLPAMKDTIADVASQGVERMLFGEARSSSRRNGYRPGGNSNVQYNRFSTVSTNRRPERENLSRRARANHDFDEIILSTRAEAEEVIDRLFDLLGRYDAASVKDLYELVGITPNYTDEKWGWTDLSGAGVTRTTRGYLLDLPRTEPLN